MFQWLGTELVIQGLHLVKLVVATIQSMLKWLKWFLSFTSCMWALMMQKG